MPFQVGATIPLPWATSGLTGQAPYGAPVDQEEVEEQGSNLSLETATCQDR
mgnify:CR=1